MISEQAVRLRLDPSNWPEALDRNELSAPFEMNKAIEDATSVFNAFLQAHASHESGGRLTPAGIRAADSEWAAHKLPTLRQRLTKIRETAARVESNLMAEFTADLAKPATDPAEVALLQEIRSWLRSLPEQERLSRARKLASEGDRSALRAILTAPTFLTGVNAELLTIIRDEAAKRTHPARHTKLEAFRQAATAAERAVGGVIQFLEQGN